MDGMGWEGKTSVAALGARAGAAGPLPVLSRRSRQQARRTLAPPSSRILPCLAAASGATTTRVSCRPGGRGGRGMQKQPPAGG